MNKTLQRVGRIVSIVLVAAAFAMMLFTVISVLTFNRTDRSIFGFKPLVVLSDSMSATDFSAGDVVLIRSVDPSKLQPGDIIAFISTDPASYGETFTHKIRALTTTESGEPAFITYGTTTGTDDATPVTYPYVIGRYTLRIPRLGLFFSFLKTTPGYICCILIPFSVMIFFRMLDTVKAFRAYKAEEMEAMEKEKDTLRQQAEENRRMLEALATLKAELAAAQDVPPPSAVSGEETSEGSGE